MIKCALAATHIAASVVNNGLRGSTNWLIFFLSYGGTVAENSGAICYSTGRCLSLWQTTQS